MIDFTSALYLGLRHGSEELGPYPALTAGRPAALDEPALGRQVAASLAAQMGAQAGLLGPSTLHLFLDLFEVLTRRPRVLLFDAAAYPIARFGAARARLLGARLRWLPHHDVAALKAALATLPPDATPIVVCDGFCPGCGRLAPLSAYWHSLQRRGGWLVIDDTQALGILGQNERGWPPYGRGGGGSLRRLGVGGERVAAVASLAKGYGAPLAVVVGAKGLIDALRGAPTRVHCSPPSFASLLAAARALGRERLFGERLRARLASRVRRFRAGLARLGVGAIGEAFPVQRLQVADAAGLQERLLEEGVRAVAVRGRCVPRAALAFLITARHREDQIDRALAALGRQLRTPSARSSSWTRASA